MFCVGADLKSINPESNTDSHMTPNFEKAVLAIKKPIISVVEGLTLGGGFEIALLCDMIICSSKATFGLP